MHHHISTNNFPRNFHRLGHLFRKQWTPLRQLVGVQDNSHSVRLNWSNIEFRLQVLSKYRSLVHYRWKMLYVAQLLYVPDRRGTVS